MCERGEKGTPGRRSAGHCECERVKPESPKIDSISQEEELLIICNPSGGETRAMLAKLMTTMKEKQTKILLQQLMIDESLFSGDLLLRLGHFS